MAKKSYIHRAYSIPEAIIREAERLGLEGLATGGNVDYIAKNLGKNKDGSHRIALLCAANSFGGPDTLSEKVDVQIMLSRDWMNAIAIPVKTAREGMELMAKMYNPHQD